MWLSKNSLLSIVSQLLAFNVNCKNLVSVIFKTHIVEFVRIKKIVDQLIFEQNIAKGFKEIRQVIIFFFI